MPTSLSRHLSVIGVFGLAMTSVSLGCGGGAPSTDEVSPSVAKHESGHQADAVASTPSNPASTPKTPAADGAADDKPAAGGDEAGEPNPDPSSGDDTQPAADEPSTEPAADEAKPPTVDELLAAVKNKKTADGTAQSHLAQAQKLGAKPRALAEAANARGQALMASPDRATTFFELARKTDPSYPHASFNLAKLAANRGEIPQVKELLAEVAARGGKKLLDTVEFDPTFALVADDRDVQALK